MSEFTVKLALFKSEYGTVIACRSDPTELTMMRHSQISEFQDITFNPLERSSIIQNQLDAIEKEEAEFLKQYKSAMEEIKTRKAQLLSLPHKDENK